jgi:RNA polymerase sigma-70 factor, ECF subfamily
MDRSTADPEELALYEDLRRGSARAFRRLLELHGAQMGRVAGWYVTDPPGARRLTRWAWLTALDGLNMFTWHCTFRAWLFGILVAGGRPQARPALPAPEVTPISAEKAKLDWDDLPWSPRWSPAAWGVIETTIDALPLAQREVVRLRDIEGWPVRDVCDVLGLTQHEEHRLLYSARATLVERLERHLGDELGDEDARLPKMSGLAATLRLLAPPDQPTPADPELMAAFRRWRTARGLRPWHRLPRLRPQTPG